jgi:hypothetical protein
MQWQIQQDAKVKDQEERAMCAGARWRQWRTAAVSLAPTFIRTS